MQTRSTSARTGGSTLRAVRVAQGKSLRDTASQAQIDPSQLSRIERGQSQITIDALYRLANVLSLRDLARLLQPYVRWDEAS